MRLYHNIVNRLWGNVLYKFSLIFICLYTIAFYGNLENRQVLLLILLSVMVSIGIAGIGYTLNDIKDYNDDLLNNKDNLFIQLPKYQSYLLVLIFLIFTLFPWFYLPFDNLSLVLLIVELLLFVLYVLPPIRLKERGFSGILADALYAQVIPCFLAAYTYLKLTEKPIIKSSLIIVFILWLLIVGIRNIIKHQVDDFKNDINSSTQTFVIKYGIKSAKTITIYFVIPIEITLSFYLLYSIPDKYHIIVMLYLIYCIFLLLRWLQDKSIPIYDYLNSRILNEFYEIHLPFILLAYFSYEKPSFILILLINFILFSSVYILYIKEFLKKYIFK